MNKTFFVHAVLNLKHSLATVLEWITAETPEEAEAEFLASMEHNYDPTSESVVILHVMLCPYYHHNAIMMENVL